MPGVAPLVAELVLASFLDDRGALFRNGKTEWALIVLSVFLGGAGLFLSLLALERFFEARTSADVAALATAAVVMIAALAAAMTAHALRRKKMAAQRALQKDMAVKVRAFIASILKELEDPIKENPGTAMLVAVLAGFCAAQNHATV